ncbi:hypothetical protein SLA2020_057270 [Shorea laevis]
MKSDHVFRELSGSDDYSSESWSLNSDIDEDYGESIHGGGWYRDSWKGEDEINCEKDIERGDDVEHEANMGNDMEISDSGQWCQEE